MPTDDNDPLDGLQFTFSGQPEDHTVKIGTLCTWMLNNRGICLRLDVIHDPTPEQFHNWDWPNRSPKVGMLIVEWLSTKNSAEVWDILVEHLANDDFVAFAAERGILVEYESSSTPAPAPADGSGTSEGSTRQAYPQSWEETAPNFKPCIGACRYPGARQDPDIERTACMEAGRCRAWQGFLDAYDRIPR